MEGPPEKKESAPGSYEHALELFKTLKERGLKDPLDEEDPKVLEARDALDVWERKAGLAMGGVGDLERAKNLVRSAKIFLEAGFTSKDMRADVRERLDDLYATAREEGDSEVIAFIEDELEQLEPKSAVEKAVEAKLAEAAAAPEVKDSVGILILAIMDPRFKRMPAEQRARLQQAFEEYKSRNQK